MKTYTASRALTNLVASIEARVKFDRADYWDRQISTWSKRLSIAIETQTLTQGELKALFDAASQMSDDFEDYYSFMGPKRVKTHVDNYNSAMNKIRTAIKK